MVRGLALFAEHFRGYEQSYVVIGGAACDLWMSSFGLPFRATKDLDVVLLVEALSSGFLERFWEFHARGGYRIAERSSGRKTYYRFHKPQHEARVCGRVTT